MKNVHKVDGTKRVGTKVKISKDAKNSYNSKVAGKNIHSIKGKGK